MGSYQKHGIRLLRTLTGGILPALLLSCSALQPAPAQYEPTAIASQYAREVVINRDKWGVPHIFGATDNATAFGLAYAHAEDDFPLN